MRKILGIILLFAVASTGMSVAVVFSGGGGRGAYEVGVYGALLDLGLDIEGIYGASVGSLNAAGLISEGFEAARDLWCSMDYLELMNASPQLYELIQGNIGQLDTLELASAMRTLTANNGIDIEPLRNKMKEIITEEKVRDSDIELGIVLYSLSQLKPYALYKAFIPEGKLVDFVLASANFPAFTREEIDGEVFIDGGVYSNFPLFMAKERGHRHVVAVDLIGMYFGDSLAYVNMFTDGMNVTLIQPSEQYGTVMTFDSQVSKNYLICGYLDTMKAYGVLRGERYFIFGDDDPLQGHFLSLDSESRIEALRLLGLVGVEEECAEYHYYRQFIPWLESTLRKPYMRTCELVSSILEEMASFLAVERLIPYSPSGLLRAVIATYSAGDFQQERHLDFLTIYRRLLVFLEYLHRQKPFELQSSAEFRSFLERFQTSVGLLEQTCSQRGHISQ
ncbi:MAG: patatin-like phospholipase family protein [Kosmotogaceae bacterium]|nr:patatin-like phospholipase family protein [Kosmotogaceae bacterium]